MLLVAAYWRTNLMLGQLAPLFGISKSSADRIIGRTACWPSRSAAAFERTLPVTDAGSLA